MTLRKYRPANGTEGCDFQDWFCGRCIRDRAFRSDPDSGDGCTIVADTFVFDIDDARYPKEWIYGEDGSPTCTAFIEDKGQDTPEPRCKLTPDMFPAAPEQK